MSETVIHWYRLDLRNSDLPAIAAAQRDGHKVLPVYILDDVAAGEWRPGGASRWWLHHSLQALSKAISQQGGRLLLRRGDSAEVLRELSEQTGAQTVHCTRRYEPWAAEQESLVRDKLATGGVSLKRFPGSLLHEPGTVLTQGGEPFKVFTPFWRASLRAQTPVPVSHGPTAWADFSGPGDTIEDWQLTPRAPDWADGWEEHWSPGEHGAQEALNSFLEAPIADYAEGRNLPAEALTSRLSPHLHHGEISPRQVFAASEALRAQRPDWEDALRKFQAELGWREFSYHLLHFFPQIPEAPFKAAFSKFPWAPNSAYLEAWQRGQTGYPIVDAGMRELWQTGYMHNRVRMVVASFLCKHLLQHWRHGEDWFWDTLVDADLASNSCSWQWVAGSGADASPYFRIFNPVTQGEKFDKQGEYVRRWVPELGALPDKYLHKPWEAPQDVLEAASVRLGDNYPAPIVDHREARQSALESYEHVKAESN